MKIKLTLLCLIFVLLLTACMERNYDNEEVVAIFKGEEITASDIRVVYPVTEQFIGFYVKEEVIINEAKGMGILISDEKVEELKQEAYTDSKRFYQQHPDIEQSHKRQASYLHMSVEKYLENWFTTKIKRTQYIQEYIDQKYGETPSAEKEEEWGKVIENDIDQLVASYKEKGDLILK